VATEAFGCRSGKVGVATEAFGCRSGKVGVAHALIVTEVSLFRNKSSGVRGRKTGLQGQWSTQWRLFAIE